MENRSTLVFVSHRERERNPLLQARLKEKGVDVAYRRGKLRLAPHRYNTKADIGRALEELNAG